MSRLGCNPDVSKQEVVGVKYQGTIVDAEICKRITLVLRVMHCQGKCSISTSRASDYVTGDSVSA
jgi:hypothetical protein